MTDPLTPVLSADWGTDRAWTREVYESTGGYSALRAALDMAPDDLITMVKDSGLRGRGGAGFPTGMKWSFIPQDIPKPKYLVVNADESEPGTCKDMPLMMATPHTLIEGALIAAHAIRAETAFIYVRGEVLHVVRRLRAAAREAYEAGYPGKNVLGSGIDIDLVIHAGAGAYICGEETALLDSLEGRRGQPRLRPPFPAVEGLYACPTVINNVESIASVPSIVRGGADWFASMGTEKSKGYVIYSLSGHVERPGQYEAPLGITLRQLIDLGGGMREGSELKFWTPGGSSTPLLTAEHLDMPLDYEASARPARCSAPAPCRSSTRPPRSCVACCAGPSSTSTSPAASAPRAARGRGGSCRPCSASTQGQGQEGDIELLLDLCENILGRSFCALGDGATSPITSAIQHFRDEFEAGHAHPVERALPAGRVDPLPAGGPAHEHQTPDAGLPAEVAAHAEPPVELVTLTIDDVEVSVPKGTLVIRAAELVGTEIPRFCDHPLLDPVGACRQCLVDITDAGNGRGFPKPQASCTIEVAAGMVVKTQVTSPVAEKAQRGNMEFLLINHPLDCPVCDKGGECPLQNQAMTHGQGESRFVETKRTFPKPIKVSEQVLLDRERCVLCARCTRFSEQIAGDPFIALIERGAQQQVGIYEEEPFSSYFSGNTIQICPVGALTSADYRFRSRPFDLVSTPSIAEHDASGSAIRVDHRRGKVMRRLAGDDPEVNEEWITDKDRFAFTYATRGRPAHDPAGPQRRDRRARARLVARGPRGRRPGPGRGRAARSAC